MKTNLALAALSQALTQNDYPESYLHELARFIKLTVGSSKEITKRQTTLLEHVLFQLEYQTPVEYIIGEALFKEHRFVVTPDVLIPRFDTEQLVDTVIAKVKDISENFTVIDIGTGSGAIIISIYSALAKFVNAKFIAIDISAQAIAVAKLNAKKLIGTNPIEFQTADTFPKSTNGTPLIPDTDNVIIVSNPPYISNENYEKLPLSVKNYEPELALRVQKSFIPKLQNYINLLQEAKKTIYASFEYSDAAGTMINVHLTPKDLSTNSIQELLRPQN